MMNPNDEDLLDIELKELVKECGEEGAREIINQAAADIRTGKYNKFIENIDMMTENGFFDRKLS